MHYLVRQPRTLEGLATARFKELITLTIPNRMLFTLYEIHKRNKAEAEYTLSRQIETVRDYLQCSLPCKFHQKVANLLTFNSVMKANGVDPDYLDPYQRKVFGRMIETIFSKSLRSLRIRTDIFLKWTSSKFYILTGLTELILYPTIDTLAYMEDYIVQILTALHGLKSFALDNGFLRSIDNIFRCLVDNCKLIEVLTLINIEANDENIRILTQLQHLKTVYIIGSVSEEGIANFLMSCENIEYINNKDNQLADAFERIASLEESSGKRFKLKFFRDDFKTTLRQLENIVEMCPMIKKIVLSRKDDINYLRPVKSLQLLSELELGYFDFYRNDINTIIQARVHNLTKLYFYNVCELDNNALMCISQTCQKLEHLAFITCHFTLVNFERSVFEIPPLMNLNSLLLLKPEPSLRVQEQLFFMIARCPNVELVHTFYLIEGHNEDITSTVLVQNPLLHLKEMIFSNYWQPPMKVVQGLLQNCIFPPIVTVYDTWSNYVNRHSSFDNIIGTTSS